MVAYLFALSRALFSQPWMVRVIPVALAHFTLLVWYRNLADFLPQVKTTQWLWLFLLCPLTGLGGVVITPDLPLLFFWSLSTWFALRILQKNNAADFAWFGAALGLGFCSKYHVVLLALAGLLLCSQKKFRDSFFRPGLFLTFMTGLLTCAPVLGWNAQHDWASFRFQLSHGFEGDSLSWHWPAEYIVGQLLLLSPAVLISALVRVPSPAQQLLRWISVVPAVFFLICLS